MYIALHLVSLLALLILCDMLKHWKTFYLADAVWCLYINRLSDVQSISVRLQRQQVDRLAAKNIVTAALRHTWIRKQRHEGVEVRRAASTKRHATTRSSVCYDPTRRRAAAWRSGRVRARHAILQTDRSLLPAYQLTTTTSASTVCSTVKPDWRRRDVVRQSEQSFFVWQPAYHIHTGLQSTWL